MHEMPGSYVQDACTADRAHCCAELSSAKSNLAPRPQLPLVSLQLAFSFACLHAVRQHADSAGCESLLRIAPAVSTYAVSRAPSAARRLSVRRD